MTSPARVRASVAPPGGLGSLNQLNPQFLRQWKTQLTAVKHTHKALMREIAVLAMPAQYIENGLCNGRMSVRTPSPIIQAQQRAAGLLLSTIRAGDSAPSRTGLQHGTQLQMQAVQC